MGHIENRLAAIMAETGTTIRELARATSTNKATIQRLRANTREVPAGRVLEALCNYYGVTPGDLLVWVED